ncbi:iron ABC transporter permease [Mucilaginibacter gynuensis]|uniref:Iron ABC transporter permease n=1 Tax=Mucilaginibacter gynuensis TaxID=1302236 RepID=A0ABP8GEL8_9SPHI
MKKPLIYTLMTGTLVIAMLLALAIGAVHIPLPILIELLLSKTGITKPAAGSQFETILFVVRMPRVVLSLLVGAALGISGAAVQAIFRNPLAEPGLLGISAGASLAAVFVIVLQASFFTVLGGIFGYYVIAIGALTGATLTAFLIYQLSSTNGRPQIATMLLMGIAVNALCTAVTGLITANAEESELRNITFWMLGSLSGATWELIYAIFPFVMASLILLPLQGQKLNAFVLGERQAEQLGVKTKSVKRTVIMLSTMAVGACVAVSGIVGFVGLIVPHLVRLMGGVNNRFVLPASAILGATTLCLADLLARIVTAPIEQPIGVITALIGSPVFIFILLRDKNKISS